MSAGTPLILAPMGIMLVITILSASFNPTGWNYSVLIAIFGIGAGASIVAGINLFGSGLNDTATRTATITAILAIVWTGVIALNWGQLMMIPHGTYIAGGLTMLYVIGIILIIMDV